MTQTGGAAPGPTAGAPIDQHAVDLVVRFARAAHRAGFPSDDLERRVEELGQSIGLEVSVSATPTLVEVAVGTFPRQRSTSIRVVPQPIDLDLVGRLDDIADQVRRGRLDRVAAFEQLRVIRRMRRPTVLVVGAYALAGGAVTPIVGGGWRDSIAAMVAGLAVGVVAVFGERRENTRAIVTPVAAIAASIVCFLLAWMGLDVATEVAILGALVAVLPGMTLTIGMRELATMHPQSGIANAAVAFIQLVGLVFGVTVGTSIAVIWFGPTRAFAPASLGLELEVVAAAVAGLAFVVTLNANRRDAVWASAAAVLAIVVDAMARPVVGGTAAIFVAALVVGLAGNTFALLRRRSALVVIVPGILMLVPGSTGYESATKLLGNAPVEGLEAAFDTVTVALSIVYGLIVSAALLPDRRRLTIADQAENGR